MNKVPFLLACFTAMSISASAQDKIYRHNGKVVLAKVIEVGTAEVKYREFENPDGPVYILEADRIKKIVYENGKEEKFGKDDPKDKERYANDRAKAIKINFFSPLYGYTEIGYEKSVGAGRSIEFSIGGIGLGKSSVLDFYNNGLGEERRYKPRGVFVSGGYKFNKLPDFILFGRTRMSHLMQGTYLKPVAYVGHYSENYLLSKQSGTTEMHRQKVTFGAIQLEVGKQWVFGEKVTLDLYWGLGYGFDNKHDTYKYEDGYGYANFEDASAWNYANARGGRSPGLSATFGVKLGLLLK
ncbi:MAG: hypothetical protein EOO09_00475 [Chitinophagaceae bacterium]|nr:MAG: hypothetical protein EOO09_00475 [Chitinophagaceae bacterium]